MNIVWGLFFLIFFVVMNTIALKLFIKKKLSASEKLYFFRAAYRWIGKYGENLFLSILGVVSAVMSLLLPIGFIFQTNSLSFISNIVINVVTLCISMFFLFTVKIRTGAS